MDGDKLPLIRELCFIANTRNKINLRRHRGRYRKNYYTNAIRVVEAWAESNYELRQVSAFSPVEKHKRAADIRRQMKSIRDRTKKPVKWQKMGLHKLRMLALQGEADYAQAKFETMELSIKTRARVRALTKAVGASLRYNNGSITHITLFENASAIDGIHGARIEKYAKEYELDKEVDKLLTN